MNGILEEVKKHLGYMERVKEAKGISIGICINEEG
jgi:hypothetical protein